MKKRPLLILFALLAVTTVVVAGPARLDRTEENVRALASHHFLSEPEYWRENATAGGKCDGAKVAKMLVEVARVFRESPTTPAQAIETLTRHRVIGTPDVWTKGAVEGGTMSGANVAAVLDRCASQLPLEPPKSAKAAPLEAIAPGKIKDSYEVIIAGAGTGGVGAAVQAARMGRSVLLLEETDWIGGQMNAAAVTSMDEGVTLVRERGLYRELCGLIASHYQPLGVNYLTAYWNGHVCVEPRVGRRLLHVLLGDARGNGVLDLALRTRVTKVTRSGDTVTGVEIESVTESGPVSRHVESKVLVDATEWGDVIPLTGARYRVGNCTSDAIDPAAQVQDNTWTAVVKQYPQGVPDELVLKQPPPGYTEKVAATFARLVAAGGDTIDVKTRPWTWDTYTGYRAMPDSSRPGNSPPITRTHLNAGNDYHSTAAEIENPAVREATNRAMRLKTLQLLYHIQHNVRSDWAVANDEGFDTPCNREAIDRWIAEQPDLAPFRAVLYHFSIIPYTRESRRIIGLHTLTAREIERKPGHPVQFTHTVALGDYAVDLHGSMTMPHLEPEFDRESDIPHKFSEHGVGPFSIPFECFIPEKIDGFLPAEKNLSQSRLVSGATRLQPHTLLMGQAAGAIAALAIEKHVQPRALDPVLVQRALLEAGDTLCIDGAPGTRWGTPEWREQQLATLRDGAKAESAKR